MDKGEVRKFDIHKNKKFLPSAHNASRGTKLKNLRLNHNMTLKQLSKAVKISDTTLMHVEQNKIKFPYHYWKMICDYFGENHVSYLNLYSLAENSTQEKLIKIRAYIGAKKWGIVGDYLGYSEGFTIDLLTRYTPNDHHLNIINSALNKLKTMTD